MPESQAGKQRVSTPVIRRVTLLVEDENSSELFKKEVEVTEFASEYPARDLLDAAFRMVESAAFEFFGVK